MKSHLFFLLFLSSTFLMASCSGTFQSYRQTIEYVLKDRTINVNREYVSSKEANLLQVVIDDEVHAVLVRTHVDGEMHRWASLDQAVLTIYKGVIVQTEGMANDIHYTSNLRHNPLASKDVVPYTWNRMVDIDSVVYGANVSSNWRVEGESTQLYFGEPLSTIKITETVTFPDTTPFIDTGLTWVNTYYLDKQSKVLLSSRQKLSPKGQVFDLTYLTRANVALSAREQ